MERGKFVPSTVAAIFTLSITSHGSCIQTKSNQSFLKAALKLFISMHENIKRYLHGITEALSSSKNKTFGTIHLLQIKQTEKHLHRELQKVGKPTSLIDADDFHYSSRYRSILSKIVEDGQDFRRARAFISLFLSRLNTVLSNVLGKFSGSRNGSVCLPLMSRSIRSLQAVYPQ